MNTYVMVERRSFSDDTRRDEASGDLFDPRPPTPGPERRARVLMRAPFVGAPAFQALPVRLGA